MSTANDRAVLNQILNPLMPADSSTGDNTIEEDAPIDHPNIELSRELEKEGVQKAEQGDVSASISLFSQAIEACPINPSAFNNRAQAHRLAGDVDAALSDLDQAISISGSVGRSGCQALVQRAMIYRLKGDNEKARADFEDAAALGSSFAKMQAVAMNPYAAMCNKMLAQVFNDLKEGREVTE